MVELKLFDLDTKEIFDSHDVKSVEDVFPYNHLGEVDILPCR